MAEWITCGRCGMTSHHPTDVEEGYCGNCHEFTDGIRTFDVPGIEGAVASVPGPVTPELKYQVARLMRKDGHDE